MRTTFPHPSRGVAMLLVIVSLATATVLSLAYLSSRDNSAVIGQNVADAAAARWTADSGLQMALAILQTESQWRTTHDDGELLHDYPIAGGTINVVLRDVGQGTEAAPDSTSENIQVTVTATVDGVEQIATALAYVPATPADSVDVDLSEFAVFAGRSISLEDDSTLTRWPMAPLSRLGSRVAIGTRATDPASVTITDDAAPVDTTLYQCPGASDFLLTSTTDAVVPIVEIGDDVPMPRPPRANVSEPDSQVVHPTGYMSGGQTTVSLDTRWSSIRLENGARVHVHGDVTLTTDTDRQLLSGARMLIYDHAQIVTFDDLQLDDASIELVGPESTLSIFVRGDLHLNDSYIGEQRPNGLRDSSGYAPRINPERIRVFSMPEGASEPNWLLEGNSVMKATVFCPDVHLVVRNESALYGRAAVSSLRLSDHGAMFYDPALDTHRGYTNPESHLFDPGGSIRPAFHDLVSLNPDAVQVAADESGAIILATGAAGLVMPADYAPPQSQTPQGEQASPRPVAVQYSMSAFGCDMRRYE